MRVLQRGPIPSARCISTTASSARIVHPRAPAYGWTLNSPPRLARPWTWSILGPRSAALRSLIWVRRTLGL